MTEPPPAPSTSSPGPTGRGPALWLGLAALGVIVGLPAAGHLIGLGFGFDTLVMETVNACPLAVEALGSPIVHGTLGLSCGGAEGGCGEGDADWSEPVAGPKGRGSYHFVVHGAGGQWTMEQGVLTAGGKEIDVAQCVLAARGLGVLDTTRLHGRVAAVTGAPPVATGASCDVTVGPGGGSRFGCRVVVACGGPPLYGATEHAGYTGCRVQPGPDGRPTITALDQGSDRPDGDPALDLHTATGELLLNDRHGAVPWGVTLRLEGDAQPRAE